MSIDSLRTIVGSLIIGSHLFSLYLVGFTASTVATSAERIELALIISPLFAMYAAVVVRSLAAGMRDKWDAAKVHPTFAATAIGLSITLAVVPPVVILQYVAGNVANVSDLKAWLSAAEICLGLYSGIIIETVFGERSPRATGRARRTARRRPANAAPKRKEDSQ